MMDHRSVIHAYYDAYRTRDRTVLEKILMPRMSHRSPFGEYHDRDKMLDEIWPAVGAVWAIDLEIYGDGPEYMVRYRHNVDASAPLAEYIRFEGDRIAQMEVYVSRLPREPEQ